MIINDKVWGNIEVEERYECIVNSTEVKKLKNKKQLGMVLSDKAIHTRFDHSLGVYYLACKLVNTIKSKLSNYIDISKSDEDAIKIMALVHDIGHGPFSHLAERLLNESHENNTVSLLKNNTDIHNIIINNFGSNVLDKVIYLIELKEKVKNDDANYDKLDIMFIVSKLLSGGIDIDRLDYLARDSYYVKCCKYDFSNILDYINLEYVDDYLEIVFDEESEYLIANYLNKRYELYDTLYLNDKKSIIESALDKLITSLNYEISWNSDEEKILEYIKERAKDNDLYIKRLSDIVLNKKIDDNIKYLVFDNKKSYDYFLDRIKNKYCDLDLSKYLFTTSNKLNIYSNKNRIYINKKDMIMDMHECPILNSNLQREKYIIAIDFLLLTYLNDYSKIDMIHELENEFLPQVEFEKKYMYINNDLINQTKENMINYLKLNIPIYLSHSDIYYDSDNKLKEKGITLRNRVVNDTDIWNIKEKVNDKSSITKRLELTFDNIDDAIKYLEEVKSINVNKLDILYNSTTLRESYLLQYLNSVFEISFDKVILNDSKNKSSLDMIECELKKGVPTDLYYLNKLIHGNFDNLIDCANSKSEMLTSKIKVRTR